MPTKFTTARLHPHEEVLQQDGDTLLFGLGRRHLTPDFGEIRVLDDPTDEKEVDSLEG